MQLGALRRGMRCRRCVGKYQAIRPEVIPKLKRKRAVIDQRHCQQHSQRGQGKSHRGKPRQRKHRQLRSQEEKEEAISQPQYSACLKLRAELQGAKSQRLSPLEKGGARRPRKGAATITRVPITLRQAGVVAEQYSLIRSAPACSRRTPSKSAWTAKALGATTRSSSCGAPSSMRRCIGAPTIRCRTRARASLGRYF